MNSTKILLIAVVVIVVGGAAFFLTRPQSQDVPAETENTNEVIEEDTMEENIEIEEDADVTVIDMTGDNFSFDPSEISVQVGETVRVVLTANDMPHDFVIDELDVRTDIAQPGETVEVEFTATEAGEYEYYCSVGNHRAQGMVGTLTVTE